MKVLIVGSGGREHAIACGIAKARRLKRFTVLRAMLELVSIAQCVPIGAMEFDRLADFAQEEKHRSYRCGNG